MYLDANAFPTHHRLQTDVCIVGAGPAGLTLALALAEHGLDVLLLESGSMRPSAAAQTLATGTTSGQKYHHDLSDSCLRAVGGTGHGWCIELPDGDVGVRLRTLDAIDFEARPGVPYSGWPVTKSDLDPYYARAHIALGMGPCRYDGADWATSISGRLIDRPDLGLETTFFQFARRSWVTDELPARCRKARTGTLVTHATVTDIRTHPSGRGVRELRLVNANRTPFTVEARTYVLAAGGIQTPRLLLLSDRYARGGIGNEHDLVGRFFMEHPHTKSGWFVPYDPEAFARRNLYSAIQFAPDGTPLLGYLHLCDSLLRTHHLPNYCAHLRPSYDAWHWEYGDGFNALRSFRWSLTDASGDAGHDPEHDAGSWNQHLWSGRTAVSEGAAMAGHMLRNGWDAVRGKKRAAPAYRLAQMSEQCPNPDSRVRLSRTQSPLGLPEAHLHWDVTDTDFDTLARGQQLLREALRQAGLGEVKCASRRQLSRYMGGGHHHMGTTRMSDAPTTGVVDPDGRVWGVDNLYVTGSSVFPTSGCANPTLTIVALALRLADHLNDAPDRSSARRSSRSPSSANG